MVLPSLSGPAGAFGTPPGPFTRSSATTPVGSPPLITLCVLWMAPSGSVISKTSTKLLSGPKAAVTVTSLGTLTLTYTVNSFIGSFAWPDGTPTAAIAPIDAVAVFFGSSSDFFVSSQPPQVF